MNHSWLEISWSTVPCSPSNAKVWSGNLISGESRCRQVRTSAQDIRWCELLHQNVKDSHLVGQVVRTNHWTHDIWQHSWKIYRYSPWITSDHFPSCKIGLLTGRAKLFRQEIFLPPSGPLSQRWGVPFTPFLRVNIKSMRLVSCELPDGNHWKQLCKSISSTAWLFPRVFFK